MAASTSSGAMGSPRPMETMVGAGTPVRSESVLLLYPFSSLRALQLAANRSGRNCGFLV